MAVASLHFFPSLFLSLTLIHLRMWSGKPSKKEMLLWWGQLINETDLKRLLKSLSLPTLPSLRPFIISLYGGTWAFQRLGFAFWGLMEPPADWDIKRPAAEGKAERVRPVLGYMVESWGGLWLMRAESGKKRRVTERNKVYWPEQSGYSFVVISVLPFLNVVCSTSWTNLLYWHFGLLRN